MQCSFPLKLDLLARQFIYIMREVCSKHKTAEILLYCNLQMRGGALEKEISKCERKQSEFPFSKKKKCRDGGTKRAQMKLQSSNVHKNTATVI